MADIAVVLGSYQSARHLTDCIASLERQSMRPSVVTVVDGASSDGSAALARELGATVVEAENRGLGHLYNTGARATDSEYVFVANTDIALDEQCLETLAAVLADDPARFAADPRQLDWSGERIIHARVVARPTSLLGAPIPGFELDPVVAASNPAPTVTANAGAMLIRRSHLVALGGFDEGFFLEYEDLDLCWRAWARGWPSYYVPDAVIRHHVGGSTTHSAASARRLAASHASLLRFGLKCLPAERAAGVVAGEAIRLLRHPRPVGSALFRTAAGLPGILSARRVVGDHRALYDRITALGDQHAV